MHAKTTHTTYDASVSKRTIIQASPISFEKVFGTAIKPNFLCFSFIVVIKTFSKLLDLKMLLG